MKYRIVVLGLTLWVVSVYSQNSFPEMHGLPVRNYGMHIPWSDFEKAYIAVRHGHPLDEALFTILNNFSPNGICFGMSALAGAVYDEGGYLGICKPVSAYASSDTARGRDTLIEIWPTMKSAILTLWCRQFSPPVVRIVAEAVSSGYFKNPVGAARKVSYYLSSNEIPILLISEKMGTGGFGGMHAILPYRVDDNGSQYLIRVYDPTWPYQVSPEFYDTSGNVVIVDKSSNTWSYYWPDNKHWTGFIYVVPGRYVLLPATNPLLISEIASAVGQVIVNGGHVKVIRDRTKELELTENGPFYTKNGRTLIFRWMPIDGNAGNGELYIVTGGYGHELEIEFDPADSNSELNIAYMGKLVKVSDSRTPFTLTLNGFGKGDELLSLKPKNGEVTFNIAVHSELANGEVRSAELKGVMSESGFKLSFNSELKTIEMKGEVRLADVEFYRFDGENRWHGNGFVELEDEWIPAFLWRGTGLAAKIEENEP